MKYFLLTKSLHFDINFCQSTCSLEPKLNSLPSTGDIAITLFVAWYFASWLIAIANYNERELLPLVVSWTKKHLLPIVQRHLFNRVAELRQSPEIHRLCAIHESGHIIVCLRLCPGWVQDARADGYNWIDGSGGKIQLKTEDDLMTEQDYLCFIVCSYGGLAAESLVLGAHFDGCKSDLAYAAQLADQAHNLFAGGHHATPIDYTKLGELGHKSEQLDHQRMAAVVQLLKQGHQRAINILSEERPLLDAITAALLKKGQLNREELFALHATHATKKA